MKNKKLLSALLVLSFAVAGCTAQTTTTNTTTSSATINGAETVQLSISDKDLDTTYDLSDTETIELSDSNGTLEISKGGNYLITGSTSNGMITIDVAEDEDVHLILKDVTIANPENSAIFIKSADEVYITLEGTNVLSNGGTFSTVDDEELDSVIYCKTDLTINGDGSLEIVSPAGHAIVCKDDMVITGGTYNISAGEDGINTNDSLAITNGVFTVVSGDDAIHTDGILKIDAGTFDITAAEGLEGTQIIINDGNITISASDDGINAAHKIEELSPYVEINGGTITITMGAGDTDGIDSNGDIIINGGTISIDGQSTCDYDGTATFNGGTLIINGEETTTIPNQFMGGGQMGGGPMGGDPNGKTDGQGRGPRG